MDLITIKSLILTGDEHHRVGWQAGPGRVAGGDLDSVYLSTAHWRQGAGAGCGVTCEVLVTHHMVLDVSIDLLIEFPGYRESGHTVTHHQRDADRIWCWRSCSDTRRKHKDTVTFSG